MIEYDYKIIRDEGDEKRTFKPDKIPSKLPNLVCIEGPNSSGKSTLLNILALGLYGPKHDKKIHKALLNKMNNLIKSKHQQLTFSIKIANNDNTLQIISEKISPDKPEIIVHEIKNGKKNPLTFERFVREYNLIYDIPDNPTERLNQLTHEIRDAQIRYGNRVGELKESIHGIITEIRSSRDPNKINTLKAQLEKIQNENIRLEREKNSFEKELDSLEKSTYYNYFNDYSSQCELKEIRLKRLQSQTKKSEKQEKRNKEIFSEYSESSKLALDELEKIFDRTTELLRKLIPKSDYHHLGVWERISINQASQDLEFNENLKEEIINFNNILIKLKEDKSDKQSFQEVKLYQDLIDVLERYKNFNITIPSLGKTITEFINELKKLSKGKQKLLIFEKNINEAISLLDQLKQKSENIENLYFPKLHELRKNKDKNYSLENESVESDILKLKNEFGEYKQKANYYEAELIKKGDFDPNDICKIGEGELEKYVVYTEMQLRDEISTLKDEINTKIASINKNNFHVERLSREIDDLQKKKPHKYQDHLEELNELLEVITILDTKLRKQFNDYIKLIIDEKIDESMNLSEEQAKYFSSVFSYLGKRLDSVRHLDKDHKVENIDLIKRVIKTKDGKNIMLADMGTGQSQSAYLKGLLNTSDNRKIIALFDEVAMMDQKSLEPIYEKFRELYNKNSLLAGIVVQKADEVNISKI